MQAITPEWLQSIEALKNVPLQELQWFADKSTYRELADGDYFFRAGDPVPSTYIVIEGRIRVSFSNNSEFTFGPKDISGYLPFSRLTVTPGTGKALDRTVVMLFSRDHMQELIHDHFELTQALVHVMATRIREFTALQQQNEKMMALGKLSAGLAHELNNPAAAIVRGSASLKSHLQLLPATFKQVMSIQMSGDQVDAVNQKMFEVLARPEKPLLTLIEKTSKEEELSDWLDGYKVENCFDIAENFAEFGFSIDDMEAFRSLIPESYLSPVLNWINNTLVTERMVNDIQEASQRISALVNSVKNFTHMDRAREMEYANIHSGIRNTLTMLNYKLRTGNIELVEDYDQNLPPVRACIGELNQVWTNLIDNAIDAMEPNNKGLLTIKTEKDHEFAKVSIVDNGAGIPENIRSKIFDPFYTTKPMGKGTGMGLDAVNRIVHQHNGSVSVHSKPGNTRFIVCFPIDGK